MDFNVPSHPDHPIISNWQKWISSTSSLIQSPGVEGPTSGAGSWQQVPGPRTCPCRSQGRGLDFLGSAQGRFLLAPAVTLELQEKRERWQPVQVWESDSGELRKEQPQPSHTWGVWLFPPSITSSGAKVELLPSGEGELSRALVGSWWENQPQIPE